METEPNSIPKLPLFSMRPEPPGSVSSPLHTSASVPFRWEEEPGKPRPSTSTKIITLPTSTKSLELPPRLMTKLPSPTTVLDGPSILSKQSRFSSLSFRLGRDSQGQEWDFDSNTRFSSSSFREGQRGVRGFKGGKEENFGGNFVFSSSYIGGNVETPPPTTTTKNGRSLSRLHKPSSHFWAAIYEGIKQKMTWSSRKSKRSSASSYSF